jgi:hypothetical protein
MHRALIPIAAALAFAGMATSCSSSHLKLNGQRTIFIPYQGGTLSISIFKHGSFWRIANKLSSKNVVLHPDKMHILKNGHRLTFNLYDEYGKMIPYSENKNVTNYIIYFEIIMVNYRIGDRIDLEIESDFIIGSKAAKWSIQDI